MRKTFNQSLVFVGAVVGSGKRKMNANNSKHQTSTTTTTTSDIELEHAQPAATAYGGGSGVIGESPVVIAGSDSVSLEEHEHLPTNKKSVACQTEPNLIDKLLDGSFQVKKPLEEIDLYQEYVRSAQCAQFWPLDKNPIRSLVPSMLKVDLPEQYLKNESLMFDLVQAITNNSKLVNLLAKYIHHIVPNVIISKRIDLIPLITCTIRNCRDTSEQERLVSLLFNLIKRPNEEQRRMILSGIIVVLQVSPNQNTALLLPNLWDHVTDKFPERRILLAESCATLAHYVRPVMRTNLILSILIQLLKDKNAAVRSAACKSFACLLTLIMDRNDEVFDACLSATEDIVQDVLQQTPASFCEHRYELEQMRFCALETVYPLLCMWAVKLNRFKCELAEFYLAKAEKYFTNLLSQSSPTANNNNNSNNSINSNGKHQPTSDTTTNNNTNTTANNNMNSLSSSLNLSSRSENSKALAAAAVARRRSVFFESRNSSGSQSMCSSSGSFATPNSSTLSASSSIFSSRRQSATFVSQSSSSSVNSSSPPLVNDSISSNSSNSAVLTSQRAVGAYLKMLNYLMPFVFSDAVNSCAWLSKSNLHHVPVVQQIVDQNNNHNNNSTSNNNNDGTLSNDNNDSAHQNNVDQSAGLDSAAHVHQSQVGEEGKKRGRPSSFCSAQTTLENGAFLQLFDRPLKFSNKLLEPTLIIDESAIVAFHDQLKQEHMMESLEWILSTFLPKFLGMIAHFSHKNFHSAMGATNEVLQEFLFSSISSFRQLCLLFGKHLTRTKIRPLIKQHVMNNSTKPALFSVYIASLTAFEPIEQHEFEEIVLSIRQNLSLSQLTRNDVEILAISIRIIATNTEQIHSPSTRQKFLTYILDALVNYSNQIIRPASTNNQNNNNLSGSDLNGGQQKGGSRLMAAAIKGGRTMLTLNGNGNSNKKSDQQQQTQTKEFMLIIFRHILTCLIDQSVRPVDWAHILVTKFLPLLISLANDSADVYVCTYARLMCAQLVETFDTYLNSPKLTKQTADAMMPALTSLKGLTEQIKASNLKRQIECLTQDLNEKFFKNENNNISDNNSNNNNNNSNRSSHVEVNNNN